MIRKCNNCGKEYAVKESDLKRGWGLCCSKHCAAKLREKSKPTYNKARVKANNIRRANWNESNDDYDNINAWADLDQWGDCDLGIHD